MTIELNTFLICWLSIGALIAIVLDVMQIGFERSMLSRAVMGIITLVAWPLVLVMLLCLHLLFRALVEWLGPG